MSRTQMALFGPDGRDSEPATDEVRTLRVLITVKAAPNPSDRYGETVCVAGISLDLAHPGWVRLYPINFRYLDAGSKFNKYSVVTVDAVRARSDVRHESWNPRMPTLRVKMQLPAWDRRRPHVEPYMESTMCELNAASKDGQVGPSLGLVRAASVDDFVIEKHLGWTSAEQAKIDKYVSQLDLFGTEDRTALEAPRFRGKYHWRCHAPGCKGHRQGNIDWELVAFQRRLRHLSDAELVAAMRSKFLGELCAADRDVAFYVGNQAKHHNVFSVLGVWWPRPGRNR